jgi:hypothetical protein
MKKKKLKSIKTLRNKAWETFDKFINYGIIIMSTTGNNLINQPEILSPVRAKALPVT